MINKTGIVGGGAVSGYNDHRMVMALSVLSAVSSGDIILRGAEAVNKSYPNFFEDFSSLGGSYNVINLRGNKINVSVFGQSHSEAIGCVIDGLPVGVKLDTLSIEKIMERRAPGRNKYSTTRREADKPVILSGLVDNTTCGAPLAMIIENTNTRSGDYGNIRTFRVRVIPTMLQL